MSQPTTALDESYFDILGLDPDAPWDDDAFEETLKRKRSEWSHDYSKTLGARKAAAERYQKMLPAMRAELSDPTLRAKHVERSRLTRASGVAEAEHEFAKELGLRSARGYLMDSEVAELVKKYGARLGDEEVRARLSAVRVEFAEARRSGAEPLDSSTMKDIELAVRKAGVEDLYSFLFGSTKTGAGLPTSTLLAKAKEINKRAQDNANKTTEVTLQVTISGYCSSQFASDAQRARYDVSLAERKFDRFLKSATIAAGPTRALTAEQLQLLLEEASRSDLRPEDALERLTAEFRKKNFADLPLRAGQVLCGCGQFNAETSVCCSSCGEALRSACPRCAQQLQTRSTACTQCGFPVGHRLLVKDLLNESRQVLTKGDIAAARSRATEAVGYWPAPTTDPLSAEIATQLRAVDGAERGVEEAIAGAQSLVDARQLYGARARLQALVQRRVQSATISAMWTRIEQALATVEAHLRALNASSLPPEDTANRCLEILSTCADCEPARQILAGIPPSAPTGLTLRVTGRRVSLSWSRSASSGAAHVIVRKAGSRPATSQDGARLALIDETEYDDPTPDVGAEMFYAVYAERWGVPSRNAAHPDGGVLVTGEVAKLFARVGDRQVHLTWSPPPRATRVFAVRTPGSGPASTRLDAVDGQQLVDADVTNGREYVYLVRCEFRNGAGGTAVTTGIEVRAIPQRPPEPIWRLVFSSAPTRGSRVLQIEWDPPATGEVRVVASAEPLAIANNVVPVSELQDAGRVLLSGIPPATDAWRESGVQYYTPAVVLGEAAYVGRSDRYVFLDDVTGLAAQNLGDCIRVSWDWPRNSAECELQCASGGWPDAPDGSVVSAQSLRVSHVEYDRSGYVDIRLAGPGDAFIVIRTVAAHGGERLLSPGAGPGARARVPLRSKVILEYEVLRPSFFRRSAALRLKVGRPATVPPLRLVRLRGGLPESMDDGECVLRYDAESTMIHTETTIPFDAAADGRSYARLFVEREEDCSWVSVRHPDREKLKL